MFNEKLFLNNKVAKVEKLDFVVRVKPVCVYETIFSYKFYIW